MCSHCGNFSHTCVDCRHYAGRPRQEFPLEDVLKLWLQIKLESAKRHLRQAEQWLQIAEDNHTRNRWLYWHTSIGVLNTLISQSSGIEKAIKTHERKLRKASD